MKGFTKDKKFRPIKQYQKKGVSRKRRTDPDIIGHTYENNYKRSEPFPVTTDGIKLSRLDLVQMQRADIGKGRRYAMDMPEPILETELTDIFGDVERIDSIHHAIDYDKLNKVVEENIKYILNRERLLGKDESISINHVSSRQESQGDSGFYQYDYTIYKGHKQTPFSGTVYGDIVLGDVVHMQLELYKERHN